MKTHYVYVLEHKETGEFYYGSRTCNCNTENDNYMGSMLTWKPDKSLLTKTIIKDDFKDRLDATKFESKLIKENINHPLNRNYHIPTKGFHGSPKGPRTKHHPFVNSKVMKQWCNDHGVECKTKNGSDVDWDVVNPFSMKWDVNIGTTTIPVVTKKVGNLLFSVPVPRIKNPNNKIKAGNI